jgi:hypothetical protein
MSIASCNTCNGAGCFTDGTKCDDCGGVGCFPIHAERPSDAEGEKLVERLRHLVSLNDERNGGPYQGYAASEFVKAAAEAADAIASLTAQLREAERERDEARARMKNTAWAAEAAEAEVARLRSIAERVEAMLTERGNITLGLHNEFRASLQPSPTKTGLGS